MILDGKSGLLALGMVMASPVCASDKQDFEACDGRMHPGKQDDGMRGAASQSPYSFYLAGRINVVGACTTALASPRLLPGQTLRRAHLLRARAAGYLQAGETDKALADLDAAQAAAGGFAGDRFYQRSMGVSFMLLRALALAKSENMASALPLVRAAIAARPYSLQVQQIGAEIFQSVRPLGVASPSPWLAVVKLSPNAVTTALAGEADVGNFAGVLDLAPRVTMNWPKGPLPPFAFQANSAEASQLLSAIIVSLRIAYARAATGDPTGARRDVATLRTNVITARPQAIEGRPGLGSSGINEALDKFLDTSIRQVEARIAVSEGRTADAIAALVASPMPRDGATIELLTALKASVPAKDAAIVPDVAPFREGLRQKEARELLALVPDTLIAPETPRAVVDYDRARPNILGALVGGALSMGTSLLGGIDRTDGFRSTANADGTTKVEFIGNTPSAPLVQEMTLLRAAELARTAGKSAFVIVDRKDYSRTMRTMRAGVEISSVPTGFKTELTIRFVDGGADVDHALEAVKIIDALGPLYYEDKPASARASN
jgi:hypothetical protein